MDGVQDWLAVHEIYESIQGESTFAGLPCTFVRLAGCNLRCRWCDTPQAFGEGSRMSLAQVLERVDALGTPLVELTGGEPLLQRASLPLLTSLCDRGLRVLLETSGERDIADVDPRVHRIVDLKAPGSGEHHRIRWQNLQHLGQRDELKFVLADEADYLWARQTILEHRLHERVAAVLLSCVHGELPADQLVGWMLRDRLPARFQLQMHKVIWGAEATGV